MAVCPNNTPAPTGREVKWYTGTARCEQITIDSDDVAAGGFSLTGLAEYGPIEAYLSGSLITTLGQCQTSSTEEATETSGVDFLTYTGIAEGDVVTVYYVDVDTGQELVAISQAQDVDTSISADTDSQAVAGEPRKIDTVGSANQTMTVNQLLVTDDFYREICGESYEDQAISTGTLTVNATKNAVFNEIDVIVAKKLDSSSRIQRKWAWFGVQATSLTRNHPVSAGKVNISASFKVDREIACEWEYST